MSPLLRVVLLWPVALAAGLVFVVLINQLISLNTELSRINNMSGFAMVAWILGPVLHWFVLPPAWRASHWAAWVFVAAGVATALAFLVQFGLMLSFMGTYLFEGAVSAEDPDAWVAQLMGIFSPASGLMTHLGAALIPLCVAIGLASGFAFVSWSITLFYFLLSLGAAFATYFIAGDLVPPEVIARGAAPTGIDADALLRTTLLGLGFGIAGVIGLLLGAHLADLRIDDPGHDG